MSIHWFRILVVVSLAGATASWVGCSKGEEVAETPAAPAAAAAAPAEGEEPPAEEAASEESTTETFVVDMSQPATPADYDSAFKKRDFLKATDVVLRMDAQNVQGADTLNRMRELQDEIARAAASGDPKAKQAADMLRRIGRLPNSGRP